MMRLLPVVIAVLPLGGFTGHAAAEEAQEQGRPSARLVAFDGLERRRNEPTLRLLDARPRPEYDKSHIPGAFWVDPKAAAALAARPGGLTDRAAWAAWIAPLGIGPDTEVLVYDGDRQLEAARLWWLLGYLGVERIGLIDGNFPLWVKQGRPTSTDLPRVEPRSFPVRFHMGRNATRNEVLEALRSGQVQVIDARSLEEYTGVKALSKRGGHIPSACRLEWTDLVDDDGRFLDPSVLRSKLGALGVKPGQPVITHCQGGGRASVDAFILERLGHPARNYYPGWSDWGNTEATPVAAGTEPGKRP
jgi:thiosulfate/3-mercaptopyruvate sulfurtransferase